MAKTNITLSFGRMYKVIVPAKGKRPTETMVHVDARGENGELVGVLLTKEQYDAFASKATAWTKVHALAELSDSGTTTQNGVKRYNASDLEVTGADTPPFFSDAKRISDFDHLADPAGATEETETKVAIGA